MRIILALAAVGLLLAAQDPKKPGDDQKSAAAPAVQEKGLVGTWQAESMEDSGNKAPADEAKKWTLVIKPDGEFTLNNEGKYSYSGRVQYNPSANPKTFEFTFTKGSFSGTFVGIYKLEGDTYTICYVEKGREAPKTFATKPDSSQMLVVYKRAK